MGKSAHDKKGSKCFLIENNLLNSLEVKVNNQLQPDESCNWDNNVLVLTHFLNL